MEFKEKLLETLRAVRPVLREPGVMVVGSEVPNLLRIDAPRPLVISRDLDIAVPVHAHGAVKQRLREISGLHPSGDEPSVWVPDGSLLEVNFVGIDPGLRDPALAHVLEDPVLPMMVFGMLSLLEPGKPVEIDGFPVPVPRLAGLLLEKLATERSGVKGDRDLLVALALLLVAGEDDLVEVEHACEGLPPELQHAVRSNLTILSLMEPNPDMPDPRPERARVLGLLRRLEKAGGSTA
jgi:hypothetical protein